MRHRHSRLRLRQKPVHARQMVKNLVTSLVLFEHVRTTKKRAEVVQPIVDRLIARAKILKPYQAIRYINLSLTHPNASRKIMEVFLERFKSRPSGFTRMTPVGSRIGDGAKLVDLAFVDPDATRAEAKGQKTKEPKSRSKKQS